MIDGKLLGTKYFDDETDAAMTYSEVMAQHGIHYTLNDLLTKKRRVQDWQPILTGSEVIAAA